MTDIIIVGGGASGIMSAISAKINNPDLSVIVLERSSKVLKKLLTTGNGRCNLLNTDIKEENFHGKNTKTSMEILSQVNPGFILDLFKSFGLELTNRFSPLIYPNSMQASSVRQALLTTAYDRGVKIFTDYEVIDIKPLSSGFEITNKNEKKLECRKLILSGGTAATAGSNSCFDLILDLGHKAIPYFPALVPLVCAEKEILKLANGARAYARLTLFDEKNKIKSDFGEVQFTDYGLSGIVTMQLSGSAISLITTGKKAEISVSLFEDFDTIKEKLLESQVTYKRISIFSRLCLMINSLIASAVLYMANIKEDKLFLELTEEEIKKIAHLLCDMRFSVTSSKGEAFSQVSGGGALLEEFDKNLCSKINPDLYAAGEMLDIYGDCGGYNLTWAWASGYTAGKFAALSLKTSEE